ncbi:MAG: T9SS type A sorting domain-containing protein, partial [Phaeodactylibacter sp.]|nr:T9SS type A sorting domain-containing protein [Phaeodactylibacter sp.]
MDNDCEAELTYPFTVEEHCTADSLSFTVFLDAGADGLLDGDITEDVEIIGSYPLFAIKGTFPVGTHALQLQVTDGCGNSSIDSLPFQIVDCFVESPSCFDGLIVELMPLPPGTDIDGDGDDDTAAMLVYVDYLLETSVMDDCSQPIRYSINRIGEGPNILQDSIYVTCDDPDQLPVEVYAWDNAYNPYAVQPDGSIGGRNYSPCETAVTLQNKANSCGPGEPLGRGTFDPGMINRETPVLYQNQPNPFLKGTTIRFWLPEAGRADIVVTDITGKAVKLYSGLYDAGHHEIEVKAEELRGYGMYFYSLRTADYIDTRQMIYLE